MKVKSLLDWIGRSLVHTSPVRLLLLICVTIVVTHSGAMLSIHRHAGVPLWIQSLGESVLLVGVLFPALYFLSFRPLIAQSAERLQAEANLRESEHKYRQLFENLGDAAFLADVETGRIIDTNSQAEKLLGRERTEILGRNHTGFFPSDKAEEYRQRAGDRGTGNIATDFEAEVQTNDGRRVPVHVSAAPLALFGRRLVVSLFRDITEFKLLHDELLRAQRLESVGALASGIAHDVNNALTPILFAAELLPSHRGAPGEQHLIETVGKSATRAAQIVRQLLTFVRGGTNHLADLQLRHLVREAAEMARVAFPKSIEVQVDMPNGLWPVRADAAQLSQVIMNLAVNARDAMPDGGELRFAGENLVASETAPTENPDLARGCYTVLRISDTGSGIAPEHLPKIFDPFFTTKPVGKGTGLGLAIVRDIVRAHCGVIRVKSSRERGTTFSLFLPAVPNAIAETAKPPAEAARKGNGELVLVTDDETLVVEMARLALESANYRVLQASDGTEALALAIEHKSGLKLAILDDEMPFLSGPATTRALHKAIPSLKIVHTSGGARASQGVENACAGEHAFLPKPFSAHQLLNAVHAALKS